MAIVRALIYWIKDLQTGLVPIGNVNDEDRAPGKIGPVLWTDGQRYPAQIIKISKCILTLEKAEQAFMEKMNSLKRRNEAQQAQEKKEEKGSTRTRSNLKKTTTTVAKVHAASAKDSGKASEILIAKALGEKIVLEPKLAAEKNAQALKEKEAKAEAKKTEKSLDEEVLRMGSHLTAVESAKRNLDMIWSDPDSPPHKIFLQSGRLYAEDSGDEGSMHSTANEDLDKVEETSCNRCRSLSVAAHRGSATEFVSALTKFCNLPAPVQGLSEVKMEVSGDEVLRYLKPLPVQLGHKKVELNLGSGLFLKKATKSTIVIDAGDDPFKLTRLTLASLYGDQLKEKGISAKGQGAERLGIEDADLSNIYNFVCRNSKVANPPGTDKKGNPKPSFNYTAFIKEVNRKLKSCSRDRKRPNKGTGPSSQGSEQIDGCGITSKEAGGSGPLKGQSSGEIDGKTPNKDSKLCSKTDATTPKNSQLKQMDAQGFPNGSSVRTAGTPQKNWEVKSLEDMGRQDAFYIPPQSHDAGYQGYPHSVPPYPPAAYPNYSGYPAAQSYHHSYPQSYPSYPPPPSSYVYPAQAPETSLGNHSSANVPALLDVNTLMSL